MGVRGREQAEAGASMTTAPELRRWMLAFVTGVQTIPECLRAEAMLREYVALTGDESALQYGDMLIRMADSLRMVGALDDPDAVRLTVTH